MPDDRFGKGTSSTTKATKKGIENIIKQANTAGSQQFLSGNVSASDRRDQITDLANLAKNRGVDFNLNTEEFTGNERGISNADPRGKLREGMTGDEYHLFMRGLHKANPAAMETAFPFSSGAGIRNIATALTPLKYLKALGSGAKEGLAKLGHKLAPGMTKDLGFHKNKFMNDLANVGPGLKKEFKKLAGLNSTEDALLNTINTEMTSSQKSAQELLQAQNEDWTDAILGDAIKDAETTVMNNAEKDLDELAIAYDPSQDVDTRSSGPYEINAFNQNQFMPHVPISAQGKLDHIKKTTGIDASGPNMINNLDQLYEMTRRKEDEGQVWDQPSGEWQAKPTAGEIDLSAQEDLFNVGGDQVDEVREQIDWNTANRPLDTGEYFQPEELTEDVIKENFITDDWGWNKGGYLKKFDDGGYANMSTFEKLKAINDSIADDK